MADLGILTKNIEFDGCIRNTYRTLSLMAALEILTQNIEFDGLSNYCVSYSIFCIALVAAREVSLDIS